MGDINQIIFLKHMLPETDGPILEIGSKDYGSTSSFRDVYPGREYVGLDMEEGPGVDLIQDLTLGIGPLKPESFKLIVCCSVLEHVTKPWIMAEHITSLLAPGGILFMSVPWVWRYHPYPDDYYRFSFKGIMCLFPALEWGQPHYSTQVQGEIIPIPLDAPGIDNKLATVLSTEQGVKRKYLPCLMVNMLGKKPA